nr:integrase, catalytic region, zinc finger, CCHC-type, peptidase aspartic, catalytic [Tanacetum cinerariifolium]
MHNNIMAAGFRDHPPMLAPGRYPQWRSRFLRYVDTRPNGEALGKCILSGPYKPTAVLVQAVKATDDSTAVLEHMTVETPTNMSPKNKAHFLAEKEAIHLILTGIGDDIYSIVDACQTIQEIKFTSHDGELMESYYTRFYKLMNEMIKNNLTVTTMQVNVQFLQQLQPEWSRFVMIVKQQHKLDEVSYHKQFDILKQYQNEVNELRTEKLARNANLLALVATAQASQDPYYQTPRSYRSSAPSPKPSIPSRSHTSTRHKGKEIAKPITPPSETASEEDNDPKQAQRDKDMQKNLALIAKYFKKIYKPTNNNLRTSSNSKNKNVDTTPRENVGSKVVQQSGIQCFNCKEYGHFGKECRKLKWVKDSAYHKEKMLLCKQAEQGVPLQAKQYDWLADTNEEVDEQELEAHYSYMAKIQENDQNDVKSNDERVALANLKLDVDENKKIQKQLKKANTTLAQELKECKAILAETSKYLGQVAHKDTVIREGLKTKAYELSVVKEKHDELMKQSLLTKSHYEGLVKQKTKVIMDLKLREEHDIEKMLSMEKQLKLILDGEETLALERDSQSKLNKDLVRPYDYTTLNSLYEIFKPPTQDKSRQAYNVMTNNINHFKQIVDDALLKHSKDLFRAPTAHDMEILIQTCLIPLAIKTQSDSLKFVHELKQEMHADLKYVESLEKEIDGLDSDKAGFSDMYDVILQECVSKDVMCSYLMSLSNLDALDELQCMYLHKVKELEKHLIFLEIALQNCKEQVKNETVCNEKALNVFQKEREQYFEIQDLKAKLQDKNIAISELRKLIEKGKGKYVDTKFDRPYVVRQPNAQQIPKPSVIGKPTPFSNSLDRIYFQKTNLVPKANVSEGLSKPVTTQTLSQTAKKAVSNTNVLKPRMYRINNRTAHTKAPQLLQTVRNTNPCVSTSTGVNHKPNVSRPQLKSNQSRDKVLPNNSQVKAKKTQVEVYPRIPNVSNKIKSVTACKDSLNSRTLNANAVCATCNKCLVYSNHFACVTKMLNDVHARTKKPTVVPISTRKPKSQANKSVATHQKKKIVQLILFIVDSRCTKHMTGNLKLLCNFVEKFLGTVCFGNDQFALILGYGDLVQGNVTINKVYYVKGLNHNLFSVGQFCDTDLEVAFRKSTCFVRDLQGNDLLTDKIKEKADQCVLVGYSTQSKGYWVYNKRTRIIDANVPSQQELNLLFGPLYDEFFNADANVPSQQELNLLFGPLYDEFCNAGSNPSMNIQSTSAPSTHTNVNAKKNNNDQAEEGEQLQDDEFTNPFCTKDHPLEQVRGNPSRPVQTRRHLATDLEMCMYALTVSTAESKNIKEAMVDSAWIEAMQEELHQFDRIQF